MDAATLKLAKNYTNEQVVQKATNSPVEEISFDGGIYSVGNNVVNGQISDVRIKGQTWTNLAGAGDTSPQTVDSLDATKTYLLINSAGANVTIDTVDTPTPVKLTGATSFDFGWASGKIALYELSTAEAALTEAQLGARYHYVSGTKSTISAMRLKSVGKNLFDESKWVIRDIESGKNVLKFNGFFTTGSGLERGNPLVLMRGKDMKQGQTYTISGKLKKTTYFNCVSVIYNDFSVTTANAFHSTSYEQGKATIALSPNKTPLYMFIDTGSREALGYAEVGTLMVEEGTTATPYEPYTESIAYIPNVGELRSLPNGTKDEVNVTTGKATIRIGHKTDVASGTVINYVDMADGGQYYAWNEDGETETGIKGDTLGIDATTLIYQLATPIVTKLPAQAPLQVFENGTVYVEPIGDASESTLPTVELTAPIAGGNKVGIATHDYAGAAADWVLTSNEGKCTMLKVANAGGAANIIAPDRVGKLFVVNNLSGQIVTVKKAGGTGVAITNGKTAIVMHNGTDYIKITSEV